MCNLKKIGFNIVDILYLKLNSLSLILMKHFLDFWVRKIADKECLIVDLRISYYE
jgi:hypothetical protein